jgi:hypothetical protein
MNLRTAKRMIKPPVDTDEHGYSVVRQRRAAGRSRRTDEGRDGWSQFARARRWDLLRLGPAALRFDGAPAVIRVYPCPSVVEKGFCQ